MMSNCNLRRPQLARGARYRWDKVREQHQIVFPESMIVLNETGAAIVPLCDGRTTEELIAEIEQMFPGQDSAGDVHEFLGRLLKRGLLRDADDCYSRLRNTEAAFTTFSSGKTSDRRSHVRATRTRPLALLAELTYRCPLKCPYCSNPIELGRYNRELDTDTWKRVLAEAAELGVIHVHFSGGEPLVRRDLAELVGEARKLDLYSNLSTGATLADEATLERLRDAGLDALQISLLDSRPDENDFLAGRVSFEKKRHAVEIARQLEFPLTLNVVLHRHNLDRLEEIISLACQWDVDKLELAHTQYVGWAFRNRRALLPTQQQVRRAGEIVGDARERLDGRLEILHVLPDYFQELPKACLHGWGNAYLTVAPDGAVLPCQAAREIAELEFENVQQKPLDTIWFDSPAFNRFRGTQWMPEPCRSCDRREIDFGGCRCQAYLLTGDVAATDPVCHLSGQHDLIEAARAEAAKTHNAETHDPKTYDPKTYDPKTYDPKTYDPKTYDNDEPFAYRTFAD